MNWITLSAISTLSLAAHSLCMVYFSRQGIGVVRANVNIFFFVFLCLFVHQFFSKDKFPLPLNTYPVAILGGITGYFLVIAYNYATKSAPNAGYVNAIQSNSAALIAIYAFWFLGDQISWMKMLGVGLCIVGAIIISIS